MGDIVRPVPRGSWSERLAGHLAWFGAGRLAGAAVSVAVVAVGGWWLVHSPAPPIESGIPLTNGARASAPSTIPEAAVSTVPGPAGSTTSGPSPAPAVTIVVQVAGAVVHPGVFPMPAGARVYEAVSLAGGAAPDGEPEALNLAAPLADGQRVYVPAVGEVVAPAVPGAPVGAGTSVAVAVGPVDLNRADAATLDGLPGIGPATAAAIVAYRDTHGPFAQVDDLLDVRGIGEAKLEAIRGLVTV